MEATNLALGHFSSTLLSSGNPDFVAIPEMMLGATLNKISEETASVTRRSAGLPMTVLKIIAGEKR